MKKSVVILMAFLFTHGMAQDRFQKLDSLLNYLEKNNKFMGSLCIREGENVVFNKAYGAAVVEKNSAADRLTKYKIGSITKTFTAVMIMQLIEEKKLTLQTKLNRFYPKIPNAEKISISDLLHHRSGILEYINKDTTTIDAIREAHSKAVILKKITGYESVFEPGSKYEYSNSNFYILGCIVENITKKSYAENLESRIVKKVNLSSTYYSEDQINSDKKESYSYFYDGNVWVHHPEHHTSLAFAAGGITSNPADLTRFMNALFEGKLINKKSLDQMVAINQGYGKGIMQFPFGERKFYGHGGKIDNFQSMMGYYPSENMGFALISNGPNFGQNDLIIGILSIYYKLPFPFPNFKKLEKSEIATFIGNYSCKDLPIKITISEKEGNLMAQATGQPSFELVYKEEKKFIFAPAGIEMIFGENSFVLKQGGMSFNFTKE